MHNRRWVGDDLHNLLYLPMRDLLAIYPNSHESLRAKRKLYRKKVKEGKLMAPSRSESYPGPDEEKIRAASRRKALSKPAGQAALSQMISNENRKKLHDMLDQAIDRYDLPPEVIGELRVKKVSTWDTGHKNAEGEWESHPSFGIQLDADPKKFEPEWVPVNRVESIKLPKKEQSEKDRLRTSKKAIVLSDLQIPYADEKAVEVALEALRDYKPDKVVLVGDLLDLSAWSKYIQRPEWATATQGAINQAHELLAKIRKLAPTAEIVVLEGNHDARMEKYALNNAQAAFGLRRADQPEGWPVLSVPYLTAMDTLDIEYVSGYPANRYWINKNLQVRHGSIARKGNTAIAVAQEEWISTIFGHIHRVETQFLTHHTYEGGKTIGAWSIGCLCDIMGKVPSVKGGVDLQGHPVPNAENWQHGFAVVDYEDDDGAFNVQPVYINTFMGYSAIVNGRKYEA